MPLSNEEKNSIISRLGDVINQTLQKCDQILSSSSSKYSIADIYMVQATIKCALFACAYYPYTFNIEERREVQNLIGILLNIGNFQTQINNYTKIQEYLCLEDESVNMTLNNIINMTITKFSYHLLSIRYKIWR